MEEFMRTMLINTIEEIKRMLKDPFSYPTEDHTKEGILLRLLSVLGWNIHSIYEVSPEYEVEGYRVDYALLLKKSIKTFIEAKKVREELDEASEKQLLYYSFLAGVKYGILTNGVTWRFYLPFLSKSWKLRLFAQINLEKDDSNYLTDVFIKLLTKQVVKNITSVKEDGQVLFESQANRNTVEIRNTWNRIVEDKSDILEELIQTHLDKDAVSIPSKEDIHNFLVIHKDFLKFPQPIYKNVDPTDPLIRLKKTSSSSTEQDVRWNSHALQKVREWLEKYLTSFPEGTILKIGKVAKKTRDIAYILPDGNVEGVRYLLKEFATKGLIKFSPNNTIVILKRK